MEKANTSWESGDKSGLISIGSHKLYAEISGPVRPPSKPLVIIFPGSGAACETWTPVSTQVATFARVLLYDRAGLGRSERSTDRDTKYKDARELSKLLKIIGVNGPYVLVAHSYGGFVAREFLQLHSREVVGMVLSETGTEPKCRDHEEQYRTQILGDKPLSVIRGEASFARTFKSSKDGVKEQGIDSDQGYREMLQKMEEMDEQLKKEQLRLSRNNKFRNVPDCGHTVHIHQPDVVVEEVRWLMKNITDEGLANGVAPSWSGANSGTFSKLLRRILRSDAK